MKHFDCKEFFSECDWSVDSNNENEIVQKAAEHGKEKHGLKEVSEDMKNLIRSKIRETKAA